MTPRTRHIFLALIAVAFGTFRTTALVAQRPDDRAAMGARGTTIAGTVRDTVGRPIPGVSVNSDTLWTRTDSTGAFTLEGITTDSLSLTFRALGFETRDTTVHPLRGEVTPLHVTLHVPGWLIEMQAADARAQEHNELAGAIDSGATGKLVRDTTGALFSPRFGVRLLLAATRDQGEDSNMIVSPASAGIALSLALMGAHDSTALALSSLLESPSLERTEIRERGETLIGSLNSRSDVQLEVANSVWVDTSASLREEFASAATAWGARVGTVPLSSEEAVRLINAWADSVTHGRITSILDRPGSDTSLLFLANSVYFKGKWLQPFEKDRTRERPFTSSANGTIQVPMMERQGNMAYSRAPGFQVVRLPYRGGRTAMYIILPDSTPAGATDGALPLLTRFASDGWPPLPGRNEIREVRIVLPKLRMDLAIDLAPVLESMGGTVMMNGRISGFRSLAVERTTGDSLSLFLERAIQRVYMELDEEGTEAAAVTGLMLATVTSVPPPPIPFIVDRPFLFLLRDDGTDTDLFVGLVQRP